jgi:hypothetical protein
MGMAAIPLPGRPRSVAEMEFAAGMRACEGCRAATTWTTAGTGTDARRVLGDAPRDRDTVVGPFLAQDAFVGRATRRGRLNRTGVRSQAYWLSRG